MAEFSDQYGCEEQCEAARVATRWFLAMHLLTQAKNNVSALALKRHLGVCYKTVWLVKHKIMEVIRLREDERIITGGGKAGGKLPQFRSVNILLGDLRRSLGGTYHAFDFMKYTHRAVRGQR